MALWLYAPPLDASLLALKFRRLDYLGTQLGRRLASELGGDVIGGLGEATDDVPVVTAVPLHWRRRWARGYDQARTVALAFSRTLGVPYCDLLRRRRATAPQSQADRKQRRSNLRHAFAVRDPRSVAGRGVILVDDVVTTGATLQAAARCLRRAGANSITALTVARTPPPGDSLLRSAGRVAGRETSTPGES